MTLAIFDLDNTLLRGDSDHTWGEFLIAEGIVDAANYRRNNDKFYEDYKAGQLDIAAYLEFALEPLTKFDMAQLKALHARFMATMITPMIQDKALALLQSHRDKGHYLLIITATNDFVTAPIAERLGVDDILATTAEIKDNRYTGKMTGTPCFQQGKVERLQHWLQETGKNLQNSYFYSDSINDLPLLETVTHPVAVNPCESLATVAKRQGWPIMDLHDET